MSKIFKFKLNIVDEQIISMPKGSQILSVQEQHGEIVMWALLEDPKNPYYNRKFLIFKTGSQITDKLKYIGTVQTSGGDLVRHVFESKY